MGEVLLSVDVGDASPERARAFAAALARRRYRGVRGVPGAYACHFEHGFVDEVRRIVAHDLRASGEEAGVEGWRAAHAWSALGARRVRATGPAGRRAGRRGGRGRGPEAAPPPWAVRPEPVGPLADVMVALSLSRPDAEPLVRALEARGWERADDVAGVLVRRYDLGMFDPLEERVRRDLRAAAAQAGRREWTAAWCASTPPCHR